MKQNILELLNARILTAIRSRRRSAWHPALLLAFCLTACGQTSVYLPHIKPAPLFMPNTGVVLFGAMPGTGGQYVAEKVMRSLHEAGFYEVIDGTGVIDWQHQKPSNDPATKAVAALIKSSDTFVSGEIMRYDVTQSVEKTSDGNWQRQANHHLEFSIVAVHLKSGQKYFSQVFRGQQSMTSDEAATAEAVPEFSDTQKFQLLQKTIDTVVPQVIAQLVPQIATASFTLSTDDDTPLTKAGADLAVSGDWQGALSYCDSAATKLAAARGEKALKELAWAHHCRGVALLALGRTAECHQALKRATETFPDASHAADAALASRIARDRDAAIAQARAVRAAINRRKLNS